MPQYGTTLPDESQSEGPHGLKKRHDAILAGAFPDSPIHKRQYDVQSHGAGYPLYSALLNNTIKGGEFPPEGDVINGDNILAVAEVADIDLAAPGFQPDSDHPKTQAMVHWGLENVSEAGLAYAPPVLDPPMPGLRFAFAPNLQPPGATGDGIPTQRLGESITPVLPVFLPTKLMPLQPHQTQARISRSDKPGRYEGVRVSPLPLGQTKAEDPDA